MKHTLTRVLVFDSGMGGEYVADCARKRFPGIVFDVLKDTEGMPYGNKSPDQLLISANRALRPVISDYDTVLIACHTLTLNCIEALRIEYPDVAFIGFEPAVKMADKSEASAIVILATPSSLNSDRYQQLRTSITSDAVIIEPDCSNWATQIEQGSFDVGSALDQVMTIEDVAVVLGCTHYFIIQNQLNSLMPSAHIINPTDRVFDHLLKVIDS